MADRQGQKVAFPRFTWRLAWQASQQMRTAKLAAHSFVKLRRFLENELEQTCSHFLKQDREGGR